ncbi:MAG TPA: hypothetical protein PLC32_05360 [Candidatus Omnitrophota bacterium]|nr:hypothetical protein [Candidatus Omnitrophota bacterium]
MRKQCLMNNLTLNIANIKLDTAYRNIVSIPDPFSAFRAKTNNPDKNIWHLESCGMYKKDKLKGKDLAACKKKIGSIRERFESVNSKLSDWKEKGYNLARLPSYYAPGLHRISFYLNDPVKIDFKKRQIKHFYLRNGAVKRLGDLDFRLISFAYSQILASQEGMLVHCACVVRNKKAYLFFAKAGGGKTTVAKLSKKYCVLGDDIIAVRRKKNGFIAFPTPWRQKKFINPSPKTYAPVKAVFFLHKSKNIYFKPLAAQEALMRLISRCIHFFLYTENEQAKKVFLTATDFFKKVPSYDMYFRKRENFWPALERIIK